MQQTITRILIFFLTMFLLLPITTLEAGGEGQEARGAKKAIASENTLLDAEDAETSGADATMEEGYTIGPGDVLEISMWKNEDLSRIVTVLPDGRISFPLIGIYSAAGKTIGQVKKELEEKLSVFSPEPVLSVIVRQVNSMMIFVIGKVNRPGQLVLNRGINVLQAIAMAGGLNPFAKEKEIRIFREAGNNTQIFEFDYKEVSRGLGLEQNIQLERGDIIVVP